MTKTGWILALVIAMQVGSAVPAAAQAVPILMERMRVVIAAGLASPDAVVRKNYLEVLTVFCRDKNIAEFFTIPAKGIGIVGWPYVETQFLYLRREELRQADLDLTSQVVYFENKTDGNILLLDLRLLPAPNNAARKITSRELEQAAVPTDAAFKAAVEGGAKLVCRHGTFQKTGDWLRERFEKTRSGVWFDQ